MNDAQLLAQLRQMYHTALRFQQNERKENSVAYWDGYVAAVETIIEWLNQGRSEKNGTRS